MTKETIMRDELLALAERVEALTGPRYEVDCQIWDAIYPGERAQRFATLTKKGSAYHGRLGPADMDGYVQPLRAFTASVDAAMTLVPEGFVWSVDGGGYAGVEPDQGEPGPSWSTKCGATPALALTAAALRARASHEETDQ